MMATAEQTIHQEYLARCFDELRALAKKGGNRESASDEPLCTTIPPHEGKVIPAALFVQQTFGLSHFEFWSLMMIAGCEFDSILASWCRDTTHSSVPTVSFLFANLPSAHWDAFTPEKVLRKTCMVRLDPSVQHISSPVGISEKVLHFLNGCDSLDPDLLPWCSPMVREYEETPAVLTAWLAGNENVKQTLNCYGTDMELIKTTVSSMLISHGYQSYMVDPSILDVDPRNQELLFRTCLRDALLSRIIWFIDVSDINTPAHIRGLKRFSSLCTDCLILGSKAPLRQFDNLHAVEMGNFSFEKQARQWQVLLENTSVNGSLRKILGSFNLTSSQISRAAMSIQCIEERETAEKALWEACRRESRIAVPGFIDRMESAYTWEDLVLPDPILDQIKLIAMQLTRRYQVVEEWGFGKKSSRGLGVAALFHGPSGTGKTLAAEVLAGDLNLDLFKIDLSAVVSKYIGETEKNLAAVFDYAQRANAILLFDEADSLFGKRTEVKDAHDRYANIEVSYLLQRMENYAGLSILTTNLRDNIDEAFIRRLRFSIFFPFPNQELRKKIWERMIPEQTPKDAIDYAKLAQLRICGGHIRNIAFHAAYIAADSGKPLAMDHVLQASRIEYAKLEKPLTDIEIRNWNHHE